MFFWSIYAFNFVVQQLPIAPALFHLINAVYIVCLLITLFSRKELFYLLALFYFIVFHQYSADPYSEGFYNFLSGPYKIVVLALFLVSLVKDKLSLSLFFWVGLALIVTICQLLFGSSFRANYVVNDIVFYLAALPLFFTRSFSVIRVDIPHFVYKFSLGLPFLCLFSFMSGFSHEIKGAYYFYYGHLFSFLLIYSAFYYFSIDRERSKMSFVIVLINILIFLQSAQSAHYILVLLSLITLLVYQKRFKVLLSVFSFISVLVLLTVVAPQGSWLALKTGQVAKLTALASGQDVLSSVNSLAIRYYTAVNIVDENNSLENIFGRGLGAIYTDSKGVFFGLNMHEATFPEEELNSGEYHLVHETLVRLFLHFGLLGLFSFLVFIFLSLRKSKDKPAGILSFIFFCFLWLSNIQMMGFLSLFLFHATKQSHMREIQVFNERKEERLVNG